MLRTKSASRRDGRPYAFWARVVYPLADLCVISIEQTGKQYIVTIAPSKLAIKPAAMKGPECNLLTRHSRMSFLIPSKSFSTLCQLGLSNHKAVRSAGA